MSVTRPSALIADDEPLLREALARQLAQAWPELEIVAQARNGRDAVARFEALAPDVCFLDIHMPGLSGIDAARAIGARAQLVFVTAFDQYAVRAFEHGALDYLVKPVDPARLTDTVARLQARLATPPVGDVDALLRQLAERLQPRAAGLRWLHAQAGHVLRLIAVDDVDYLRAEAKYTCVAWRNEHGEPAEAVLRTPLKHLLAELDPTQFAQVHRAVVVNLRAIRQIIRHDNETAEIELKHRPETLPISRSFLSRFRQM